MMRKCLSQLTRNTHTYTHTHTHTHTYTHATPDNFRAKASFHNSIILAHVQIPGPPVTPGVGHIPKVVRPDYHVQVRDLTFEGEYVHPFHFF